MLHHMTYGSCGVKQYIFMKYLKKFLTGVIVEEGVKDMLFMHEHVIGKQSVVS